MAAPSFLNSAQFERPLKPRCKLSKPELQPSREFVKLELPAPELEPEAVPLATLTRVSQFLVHDLRHHLSTVYANAEFLGSRNLEPTDTDELLEEIRFAVGCMTDQLDSLLLCTRTGNTMEPRRESLKGILDRAVQMVRLHPQTRHVTIIPHDIPALEGRLDGTKLSSAIFNLLLNACQAAKASPNVKRVDIDLHQNSHCILVQVSDSGQGVPDSIRETLFQPFVKAEEARGMGLGLTIARCIAQEHGGDVYLEKSSPGKTVFALTLPASLFSVLSLSS
jgi:signal transduction histidine kinase